MMGYLTSLCVVILTTSANCKQHIGIKDAIEMTLRFRETVDNFLEYTKESCMM